MYISINNIEILNTLEQNYTFYNESIFVRIDSSEENVKELLNNKDLYTKIASSIFSINFQDQDKILFPDISSIKDTATYAYLIEIYEMYNSILNTDNLFEIGTMEVSIRENKIIVKGDSPLENKSNIVYNLIALKILLDYKRKQNEYRN